MFGVGPQEMLILLVIVLVLFGSSRLPGLMRSLGRSVTEFKKGLSGGEEVEEEELDRPKSRKPVRELEENSNGNEKSSKEQQAEAK
jgi:TatA/E family protein of Tat protein translocase